MNNSETKKAPYLTNGTSPESSADAIVMGATCVVILLILTTNTFIFYVFFRNKSPCMRTPSIHLILSLSISHFLTGVAILGKVIIIRLSLLYDLAIEDRKYEIMGDIFMTFCIKATLLHLCGIALDRFISIFYPLHYKAIVTVKRLNACILFTWGIAFTASSIQLIWLKDYFFLERVPYNEKNVREIEKWYSIIIFIIVFLLTIALGFMFVLMFIETRKFLFHHGKTSFKKYLSTDNQKKERRAISTFGIMYLLFTVLTLPYFTARMILDLNLWKIPASFLLTLQFLMYTATFVNSVFYITRNRTFWLAVTKMCSNCSKSS